VADIRIELRVNAATSFTNPQLLKDSAVLVKNFQTLTSNDNERPAKRRKTLPDASEDNSRLIYEQLVLSLNGSAQDSPVLNLANLHNVIR
jgi:serine/threonine-protein kinase ATR